MVLFGYHQWIVLVWLFLLGATLGSFLNVCIYRFPRHERFWDQLRAISHRPSHCPRCGRHIRWFDNVPIFGWLKLRGRCRDCKARISVRYPFIEFGNGLLFVVLYWYIVPEGFGATLAESGQHWRLSPTATGTGWLSDAAILHWQYLLQVVLLQGLLAATFIDFDHRIIPDGTTLPPMLAAIVMHTVIGRIYLVPVWFQNSYDVSILRNALETQFQLPTWITMVLSGPSVPAWIGEFPHWHGFLVSAVGLIVGGGIVWAVRLVGFWVLRQEAMGFGDVILMAAIGAALGWQPVIVIFFLAPVCALLVVAGSWALRRDREIPYGPYLSLATLILLLGWHEIWPVASKFFSLGAVIPVLGVITIGMLAVCLYAVQLVKRILGISLYPEPWYEQWTSADQLAFFANKRNDLDVWQDPAERWPGIDTSAGSAEHNRWQSDGPR